MRGATCAFPVAGEHIFISIHAPRAGCDLRPAQSSGHSRNFNPRTPCGVRRQSGGHGGAVPEFQSTHPVRGATKRHTIHPPGPAFQSTHPVRGATRRPLRRWSPGCNFNPRTPCGVRRKDSVLSPTTIKFQSTHPVRGATTGEPSAGEPLTISIHAPRAGCDLVRVSAAPARDSISIHAPRAGCDRKIPGHHRLCFQFQSTHPVRGATGPGRASATTSRFQSTHPVRGATLWLVRQQVLQIDFNPRTPCGVRRPGRPPYCCPSTDFNPRTPCGVRPINLSGTFDELVISIHAPRAGCDPPYILEVIGRTEHFNPRTPCGVRRITNALSCGFTDFNPRTPCGVRRSFTMQRGLYRHFNPRTPCGVRRQLPQLGGQTFLFQSTHPVRGATKLGQNGPAAVQISIHAPRAGCDWQGKGAFFMAKGFQSTHPVRGATRSIAAPVAAPADFNPRTPCGVRQMGNRYSYS